MTVRLLAAIPTHSGALDSVTAETLLQVQHAVLERGGTFTTRFHSGSVISTIRNLIAADFLGSESADVLLMLDADQGIAGSGIMRMLDLGKPVVGCIYPKRKYDWSLVDPEMSRLDPRSIAYQAMDFVGTLRADEEGKVKMRDGFAPALHVGTGIMVVRREAFETMMRSYPQLKGCGFYREEFPSARFAQNWGFFNPIIQSNGGSLSEDFSFCRRWLDCGGEIWADIITPTVHVGRHAFSGNYHDFLQATDKVSQNQERPCSSAQ